MTTPTSFSTEARLVSDVAQEAACLPGSWYITHGFGKPAAGTYTEVALAPDVLAAEHPERTLEAAVRQIATELYGTAWAFLYPPEEYADAITRWDLRRRERVIITALEVWE